MNKFDRLVEQTLGYFLAVNGSLLAIVSVVVHRDNFAHLAFITPLGIAVAVFGVWFARSDYSNKTVRKSNVRFSNTSDRIER